MSACGGNESNAAANEGQQGAAATAQAKVGGVDADAKALAQARAKYLDLKKGDNKEARKAAKRAYRALREELKAKYGEDKYFDELRPKYKEELKKLTGVADEEEENENEE